MKRVLLYGDLATKWGREHFFDISSVAEAINALRANFKDFEPYMCSAHVSGIGFKVFVGDESFYLDEMKNPIKEDDTIKIVPVILGSSGELKIVLGAAMIAVGVIVAGMSFGAAAPISQGLIAGGVGLVIGGVAQLLTPVPTVDTNQSGSKQSYIFGGPTNSGNQGDGIPVGYGRMFIGSIVVSSEVTTIDGTP